MCSPLLISHSVRNLKKPHYMSCPWLSNENCAFTAMKALYSYVTVWEIWRNPITCHAHDCQMKIVLLRLWKPFTHMSQCEKSEETPLHVTPMTVKWKLGFCGYESPLLICHSVRNLKKPHYMSRPWLSNENWASAAMKALYSYVSVRNLKKPHYMSCPWLSNENWASAAMKALYSYVTVWEIWTNPITCHALPFTHMSQCEKSEETPLHVMPMAVKWKLRFCGYESATVQSEI